MLSDSRVCTPARSSKVALGLRCPGWDLFEVTYT